MSIPCGTGRVVYVSEEYPAPIFRVDMSMVSERLILKMESGCSSETSRIQSNPIQHKYPREVSISRSQICGVSSVSRILKWSYWKQPEISPSYKKVRLYTLFAPYKPGPALQTSRPLSPRTILQAHLIPFMIIGDYPDQRFLSKNFPWPELKVRNVFLLSPNLKLIACRFTYNINPLNKIVINLQFTERFDQNVINAIYSNLLNGSLLTWVVVHS